MLENYLPVLLQAIAACGFAGVTLLLSVLVGQAGKRSVVKDSAYECGMLPVGDGQPRFSVKFYLIAMLFVIFDIEVVFMYPWALSFRSLLDTVGIQVFYTMLSFIGILGVAYIYVLKKGALDWSE